MSFVTTAQVLTWDFIVRFRIRPPTEEVPQSQSGDSGRKNPGIESHNNQHQHVTTGHLYEVQQRLQAMFSALYSSPETNSKKIKPLTSHTKSDDKKMVDTALMLDIKGLLHRSYAPFFDPVSTVSVLPQAFDDLIEDAQQDTPQARQKQTWILKKKI